MVIFERDCSWIIGGWMLDGTQKSQDGRTLEPGKLIQLDFQINCALLRITAAVKDVKSIVWFEAERATPDT